MALMSEQELKKAIHRANERIRTIEREYGQTYSIKKLRERLGAEKLQALTDSGRVSMANLSPVKQRAIERSLNLFFNSQTSTKRGIKQVRKKVIETVKQNLRDNDKIEEITDREAADFFEMLKDKDIKKIDEFIGASDLFTEINEAIAVEDSIDDWYRRMEYYVGEYINNEDIHTELTVIYVKYIQR